MNIEAITNGLRHLFRVIMPPIVNLIIVVAVLRKGLGNWLQEHFQAWFGNTYLVLEAEFNHLKPMAAGVPLDDLTRFGPVFSTIFSKSAEVGGLLLLYLIVFIIAVALIVDSIVIVMSKFIQKSINLFLSVSKNTYFGKINKILILPRYSNGIDPQLRDFLRSTLVAPYSRPPLRR